MMAIALLVLAALWLTSGSSGIGVPIFGFHRIVDSRSPAGRSLWWRASIVDYPRPRLEAFLEHLAKGRYWTLTADELYRYFIAQTHAAIPAEHANEKPVALTFDDGYSSTHTELLPILERLERRHGRKITVILFINSGNLGRHEETVDYMSCEELKEGFRKGFYDVQSHTVNHLNLTHLPDKELAYELSQDQINLRRCIAELDTRHAVARHLAYPYGAVSPRVERYASRYFLSGYLYSYAVFPLVKDIRIQLSQTGNRYRIPRLIVGEHESVNRLIRLADSSATLQPP